MEECRAGTTELDIQKEREGERGRKKESRSQTGCIHLSSLTGAGVSNVTFYLIHLLLVLFFFVGGGA